MNAQPPEFRSIGSLATQLVHEAALQVAASGRPFADRLGIVADLIGAGHRAADIDVHLDNIMSRARELRQKGKSL